MNELFIIEKLRVSHRPTIKELVKERVRKNYKEVMNKYQDSLTEFPPNERKPDRLQKRMMCYIKTHCLSSSIAEYQF